MSELYIKQNKTFATRDSNLPLFTCIFVNQFMLLCEIVYNFVVIGH